MSYTFIPRTDDLQILETRQPQPTYFSIQTPFTQPVYKTQNVYFTPGMDSTPKIPEYTSYKPGVKLTTFPQ